MFRILPSNEGELLGLFSVVLDKIGKEFEVRLSFVNKACLKLIWTSFPERIWFSLLRGKFLFWI